MTKSSRYGTNKREKLNEIRNKINEVDMEMLLLLNKRIELALRTKVLKEGKVLDKEREAKVIERIRSLAEKQPALSADKINEIWPKIIEMSREAQEKNKKLIAFAGEHGYYSEVAAKAWMEDSFTIPLERLGEVIEEVRRGYIEYGVLPSYEQGTSTSKEIKWLMDGANVKIVDKVTIPVHCHLLAPFKTELTDIQCAYYSEDSILNFCEDFLKKHNIRPIRRKLTTAVKETANQNRGCAIIGNDGTKELYGLHVIKSDIQGNVAKKKYVVITKPNEDIFGNK